MTPHPESEFLYVGCQLGVENICKSQILAAHPQLRFAFSRPGFLTFKSQDGALPRQFAPRCAFARIAGLSLGRASSAETFWQRVDELELKPMHLHVWSRTEHTERMSPTKGTVAEEAEVGGPEDSGDPTGQADEQQNNVLAALAEGASERSLKVNGLARPNHTILDCVLVEPTEWWLGWREASAIPTRWVGGRPRISPPENMVSRAYFKMKEALLWSRFPIKPEHVVAEIGSSPGGACQALLETGARVIGIDPAEMDATVLAQPNFTHIRRRGAEVRRKDLAGVHWLCVDSNVAPQHSLDTLKALHEHDQVQFQGMLLTLKMPQWKLVRQLDDFLAQIRALGYEVVKPRHLHHNRQELCVAAARSAATVRKPRNSRKKRPSP